jgi:hypothetical protein
VSRYVTRTTADVVAELANAPESALRNGLRAVGAPAASDRR